MTILIKSTGLAKYLQGTVLRLFFPFCAERVRNMTTPLLLRGRNSNAGSATLWVSGSKQGSSLLSPLCLMCKTWTACQTHKSV